MEQIIHSTIHELEIFENSLVWKDMQADINIWLQDISEQLEICEDINILRKLQGNAEALRRVLDLPRVLLEHKQVELEQNN